MTQVSMKRGERLKKYKEFLATLKEYQAARKEILKVPEEDLHQVTKKLDIHGIRDEICEYVEKLSKATWEIYSKIYRGEPTLKEIDTFLSNVEELLTYEEIVSPSQRDSWRGLYVLVKAHKRTF